MTLRKKINKEANKMIKDYLKEQAFSEKKLTQLSMEAPKAKAIVDQRKKPHYTMIRNKFKLEG